MVNSIQYCMLFIMMNFILLVNLYTNTVYAESCQLAGRSGCIASCFLQNCATGYCNDKDVCVCSRCDIGRQ